jgi:hypothetical protein
MSMVGKRYFSCEQEEKDQQSSNMAQWYGAR